MKKPPLLVYASNIKNTRHLFQNADGNEPDTIQVNIKKTRDKKEFKMEHRIVQYTIDVEFVKKVLIDAEKATPGVLADPAPFARLTGVDDDTYIFTTRSWCESSQYWQVYFDVIENCSKALAENGIDDPEERIAIRMVGDEK